MRILYLLTESLSKAPTTITAIAARNFLGNKKTKTHSIDKRVSFYRMITQPMKSLLTLGNPH